MKLKPTYNYLGAAEALLDAKATSRCSNEVPVVEESISTPQHLSGLGEPATIDCAVIDGDTFLVVANITSGSPTFPLDIVGVVCRRNTDGSITELGDYQQIAAADSKTWANPHVTMVTPTKFVLSAQSLADDKLYVIVGTLTGADIFPQAPVEVAATASSAVEGEIVRIDSNRVLLFYPDIAPGNEGMVIVGTLSGVSISFGTAIQVSTYTVQQVHDIAYTDYPDKFYVLARGDSGNYLNIKISVDSGSTLSEDGESGALGHYSGTTVTVLRKIAIDMFVSASNNVAVGGEIVVNEYTTGTVKVTGKFTIDTSNHRAADIAAFGDNRFAYFYSTQDGSGRVGYEKFDYDGSVVNSHGDNLISAVDCGALRVSKNGFSATKYPVVYVDASSAGNNKGMVFTYEAGDSW